MASINAIGTDDPIEVAKGGTGVAATTAYAVQCGGTTTTGPLQSIAALGAAGTVLTSNGAGALPTMQTVSGSSGMVVQYVTANTTAQVSTSTTIPSDDTIPQNTEGGELLTLSITPTSATNILVIECSLSPMSTGAGTFTAALFQDSTANALAAQWMGSNIAANAVGSVLRHSMVSGTASSTTFKIRYGSTAGGTVYCNGYAGRRFGGVASTVFTIFEIQV